MTKPSLALITLGVLAGLGVIAWRLLTLEERVRGRELDALRKAGLC